MTEGRVTSIDREHGVITVSLDDNRTETLKLSNRVSRNVGKGTKPDTRVVVYYTDNDGVKEGPLLQAEVAMDFTYESRVAAKWRLANSRPEPLFRYFSNRRAICSSAKQNETTTVHGRSRAVSTF